MKVVTAKHDHKVKTLVRVKPKLFNGVEMLLASFLYSSSTGQITVISQTTFSNAFLMKDKVLCFECISLKFVTKGSIDNT